MFWILINYIVSFCTQHSNKCKWHHHHHCRCAIPGGWHIPWKSRGKNVRSTRIEQKWWLMVDVARCSVHPPCVRVQCYLNSFRFICFTIFFLPKNELLVFRFGSLIWHVFFLLCCVSFLKCFFNVNNDGSRLINAQKMEIKTVWISSLHYHLAIDQIKQQLFIIMERRKKIWRNSDGIHHIATPPLLCSVVRSFEIWIFYEKISNLRFCYFFLLHLKSSFKCLECFDVCLSRRCVFCARRICVNRNESAWFWTLITPITCSCSRKYRYRIFFFSVTPVCVSEPFLGWKPEKFMFYAFIKRF